MFSSFFDNLIKIIGNSYPFLKNINNVIGTVLSSMLLYKTAYLIIGLFFTRKFKPALKKHKYGIVIAARNEENVIGNLLDSIFMQDYPMDLIDVFVVADNCTDKTAEISKEKGAIIYERFDDKRKTKGFALQYLFKCIERDYKTDSYEGYFVFDADNLLKKDYISKMNDAFDAGEKIITSYRNTKNFDENWIASNYALHWLRSIRNNHRARSWLRLATNIQGTGFLFSNEIVKNGWNYTSLTEDRALTADAVAQGYAITYQNEAMFFDEQPVSLKIAWRQRLRWSKGHLLAFVESGPYLFLNIFFGKMFVKTKWRDLEKKKKKNFKDYALSLVESIRHRFASYDTLLQLTPISVLNIFRWLLISLFIYSCYCYGHGVNNIPLFGGGTYLGKFLRGLFSVQISTNPGLQSLGLGLVLTLWLRIFYRIGKYLENILVAVYIFIVERKNIVKIPFRKKVLYAFTWPIFDIIGRYTTYIALFKKIEWKPIPHNSKITIKDINVSSK